MRTPPTGSRGCYSIRHVWRRESHGSSYSLIRECYRPRADDFKPGCHLMVGEIRSDRYHVGSVNRAPHKAASANPTPARDADNRKARRAHGPCRADLLDAEHIGASGKSGYPAPDIPRANMGGDLCLLTSGSE